MKLEEQYIKLEQLKEEINNELCDISATKMKHFILWLTKNEMYNKLKAKDYQLRILSLFINIWLQERKYINSFAMQGDIFFDIYSLDDIEKKYNFVKFTLFRIEANMAYEYYENAMEEISEQFLSAYAILNIIQQEINEKEKCILRVYHIWREKNELIKAIGLLEKSLESYPNNNEFAINLADGWLEAQQIERAYEVLKGVKKPNAQINEWIVELERVLNV